MSSEMPGKNLKYYMNILKFLLHVLWQVGLLSIKRVATISMSSSSSSSSTTSSSNDIQLTAEEANKFDAAFKSEEFRKLMADYVESLTDPSNREATDEYISHLEANEELPPGKSLIRPSAGFVVKCYIRGKKDDLSKKIFLNCVYSDSIAQPSQRGTKWSVPYAIGPLRMEHDKSKALVPTFDICFHPLSLKYAHKQKEFLDMIIGISQSAVVDAYSKNSGEEIEFDCSYKILKNIRYKNGKQPQALIVGDSPLVSA